MSAQPVLFELEQDFQLPQRVGRSVVTKRRVNQILTKPSGMLASLDFTLNPYVGCSFACSYCYAAFFQPDEAKAQDWGYWVEVKENALELLKRNRSIAGSHIMVGSVTDPYQPLERTTKLTRSLLEHMATISPQPKIRIQTRSPIVARDIDVLQRFDRLTVGMSITTDDDATRKRYEPSCASIGQRFAAVRKLADAGVPVTLSLAPLLPVTNIERLAEMIRESGADRFWTGYFHPGTRKFAAGTRENALVLAKEDGWHLEQYIETVTKLKKLLPELVSKDFEEKR